MKPSEHKYFLTELFETEPDKTKHVFVGDMDFGCFRYNIGKSKMRELAEEANAVIYIGRLWRFIVPKMDKYFLDLAE